MGYKMAPKGFYTPDGTPVIRSINLVYCPDDDPEAIQPEMVEEWVGADPRKGVVAETDKPDANGDVVSADAMKEAVRRYMARPILGPGLEVVDIGMGQDGRVETLVKINDPRLMERIKSAHKSGETLGISLGYLARVRKLKWWERLWLALTRTIGKVWRWLKKK